MLAHLLAALLTQAPAPGPQVAVVVTQRSGISSEKADAVTAKLAEALAARGVALAGTPKQSAAALAAAGTKNPADCQGKRGCVSGLGRLLRVWGVLGVELADLDGTLAVHLALVDSDLGERRAELDLVLSTRRAESEIAAQVQPFVAQLLAALEAARPASPASAGAQPDQLEPAPKPIVSTPAPAAAPLVAEQPPRAPLLPVVLTFGVAAAAAAVSVAFVILAGNAKSELQQQTALMPFSITRSDARNLAQRANESYTVALACGIGAAVLVVLGAVLGLVR